MKAGYRISALAVGISLALAGCDDNTQMPPPPPGVRDVPQKADPAPPVPTTQQLEDGPRKDEKLGALPLTARVPESWGIETELGNLVFLKGHAPHGQVRVRMAQLSSVPMEKLEDILKAGKRDADAQKGNALFFDTREANDLRVMENVRSGSRTESGTALEWTVWVFRKNLDNYDAYELSFYGLTREQYEQDKPFLRKIVESIKPM